VIGEAARLVSVDAKARYPEIKWADIAGMRNRLIHEYFRVSLQIVWEVTQIDLDPLIAQLEMIALPGEAKEGTG
jgi:uncharacterized protein with HEPN domain